MIDFIKIREDVIREMSKTNHLIRLDSQAMEQNKLSHFKEVWKTTTEVYTEGNQIDEIRILLAFPSEFPLIMPKYYLDAADYEKIKYIPHINVAREICVFDEDTITVDPQQPLQIIRYGLARVRKAIEEGLQNRNVNDFKDEFQAYWDDAYGPQDKVVKSLCIISDPFTETNLNLLILTENFVGYNAVLHNNNEEFKRFKSLIDSQDIQSEDYPAIYLGEVDFLRPPFNWTNHDIIRLIEQKFPLKKRDVTRYVNSTEKLGVFTFSLKISQRVLYFGWILNNIKTPIIKSGWRKQPTNWEKMVSFKKNQPVYRLNLDIYTKDRISRRTDGFTENKMVNKIAIAGLGSIGSNLLSYLLAVGLTDIILIDYDILTLENINRHLLGFIYIGEYKTDALEIYLKEKDPLLAVKSIKKSIIQFISEDAETLNDCSYIFVVIGKTNIEEQIVSALREKILKKPLVIMWIEPFLIGGHCIFIYPASFIDYRSLFENGFYKYNMVDQSEYTNPDRQFIFQESGCQVSYIPYGQKNITLFLSGLFPVLSSELESENTKSLAISWRGNAAIQEKLNIQISPFGQTIMDGELLVTQLT